MFALLAAASTDAARKPPIGQSEMWVLIGLGVVGLIYVIVLRPMMRRKDPLERPPAFASLSQQRAVERQMQNLLVELSEMARQVTAQLDTRAARLELLIREADEKIAMLKAAGSGSPAPLPAPRLPDAAPADRPAAEETDPRHSEVYALADGGRDVNEISAQLGRPRGEVELILALRNK